MISHHVRDFHHGQMDCTLLYKDGDAVLGSLDYSVYEDIPAIQMIKVDPLHRRKKIATRLLAALQDRHPETEIDWGSLSADGVHLKNALPTKHLDTPYATRFADLAAMKATLLTLEAKVEQLHADNQPSGETIQAYYDLEDKISDLEWDLRDKHPKAILLDIE